MRVLIDECLPHDLRHHLPGHDAFTVTYMGWCGKKNGELIALMVQNGFEVLLTADKNLQYQQNLTSAGFAILVLNASSSDLADLLPLMPAACAAFDTIRPGEVIEVN